MKHLNVRAVAAVVLVVAALSGDAGALSDPARSAWPLSEPPAPPRLFLKPRLQRTVVVPRAIAFDCSADVTDQLNAFVRRVPDRSRVIFRAGGCYSVEGTLRIRGRSELVFHGNGAELRSTVAPESDRAIWRVIDSRRIVFVNMLIRGSYREGGSHDVDLQHAHGIDARGSSIEVSDVTFVQLAGDCVYFGLGLSTMPRRSSGYVHDVSCSQISRNAVSVTAGTDILIERIHATAIGLTAFDIEPNEGPGFGARRVAIRGTTVGTYYLYAYALIGESEITDQSFTDNRFLTGEPRIAIVGPHAPKRVLLEGNVVVPSGGPSR